jgi:hypothetical protein
MPTKKTQPEALVANTWDEFLSRVKDAKASFSNPEQLWFRGQSNAAYSLLPSLLRIPDGAAKEKLLFQKFLQYSLRSFPRRESDWETLFDMQHYHIPTRLFDWSENLGISTFFAINYRGRNSETTDAAVYILDPFALNKYSGLSDVPFVPSDAEFEYKRIYWEKKPFPPIYPIAIQPLFQNDRILAQKGMFTVHGNDLSPIESLCPKAVKRIVLKPKAIEGAHEFLEIANINARTVFPDMFGIADYVKRVAGL